MPENRFNNAAAAAASLTNSELAEQIANTTKLDLDTINAVIPLKRDKEAFALLMEQVNADTTMDEKLAFLHENLPKVGAVAINLLKAIV